MIDEIADDGATTAFRLQELDYDLPETLIAQQPAARREDARMLVVDRASESLHDACVVDLPDYLRAGDLLIINDTKVLPAKFSAKRSTGGVIHGLFVEETQAGVWIVMLRGSRRLREGETLTVIHRGTEEVLFTLEASLGEGHWRMRVEPAEPAEALLERVGQTPLPPYIRRSPDTDQEDVADRARYQTVYATAPGAVAAPTAGLHLTDTALDTMRLRGIDVARVTLHVGAGTFKPIATDDVTAHKMHAEHYTLSEETAKAVASCRDRGGRVVAVGTTSVRTLETAGHGCKNRGVRAASGSTNIFLHPPHAPRMVDALLTNFHLPRSTLLALVMSLAGIEFTRRAYRHAVEKEYRFFSYGDAMLIL